MWYILCSKYGVIGYTNNYLLIDIKMSGMAAVLMDYEVLEQKEEPKGFTRLENL